MPCWAAPCMTSSLRGYGKRSKPEKKPHQVASHHQKSKRAFKGNSRSFIAILHHRKFIETEYIYDVDYRKPECLHYSDALDELMWQKALAIHGRSKAEKPTVVHWRAVAISYRIFLTHGGLSLAQIRNLRLSIGNQKYWGK